MMNSRRLSGLTIFITGASRGIGKAIALKAAKDGANIIIAAKTAEPHPKLPGTIYTAAQEVEAAGGRCLPCVVDIQHENQVQSAVDEAVKTFGGIDIVVNNASAIMLTGTLETPMKRYDLMNGVNARGTFLVSKSCLPYLQKSKHAHILNISPPLNLDPLWFKNHVAYTIAKYGMSMCALGMAEEFRSSNIAVNCLWPATAIHTAAIEMLTGPDSSKWSRKPDIMADAAYAILTKDPAEYTGNFAIDEDVLKKEGVTNLEQYACDPAHANELMPDFFLGSPSDQSRESSSKGDNATSSTGTIDSIFAKIEHNLSSELVSKTQAIFQFEVTGDEHGTWFVDLKNGGGQVGKGKSPHSPDAVLSMEFKNFLALFGGKLKPATAVLTGKLRVMGNLQQARKLEPLMTSLKSKL
ncbi:unnamed protein product [Bemisia tabaci]|uniref:Hydroxysteroid dehydrogenase-like protein 2 n=1 Tax=Bemisia tabaci TaxID=7038 RepID=A0A9P0AFU0_BEMTA|nr:PREDICTED: hydroxysteroid dehydrogenase-like protein 2 [Bemisia tabaci]CAH0389640.1 unnamed protein product [Bemisia tabaci]